MLRTDAAEDAEDRLDEKRRFDQSPVQEVRQIIQVPNIVALELEAGAAAFA